MDNPNIEIAVKDFLSKVNYMADSKETGNVLLQINFINGKISKNYKVVAEIHRLAE